MTLGNYSVTLTLKSLMAFLALGYLAFVMTYLSWMFTICAESDIKH